MTAGLRDEASALRAELERTRLDFERAERRARTYLVERGVLDQVNVDVTATLAGLATASERRD